MEETPTRSPLRQFRLLDMQASCRWNGARWVPMEIVTSNGVRYRVDEFTDVFGGSAGVAPDSPNCSPARITHILTPLETRKATWQVRVRMVIGGTPQWIFKTLAFAASSRPEA